MAFSTKINGSHHLQGNVQVYNVRIPAKPHSGFPSMLSGVHALSEVGAHQAGQFSSHQLATLPFASLRPRHVRREAQQALSVTGAPVAAFQSAVS